jgi:hypothetical protein
MIDPTLLNPLALYQPVWLLDISYSFAFFAQCLWAHHCTLFWTKCSRRDLKHGKLVSRTRWDAATNCAGSHYSVTHATQLLSFDHP